MSDFFEYIGIISINQISTEEGHLLEEENNINFKKKKKKKVCKGERSVCKNNHKSIRDSGKWLEVGVLSGIA